MVDGAGFVLETTRDAVLVVDHDELWAHPLDGRVLPSVTRRVVLELARDHGIPVRLEPYPYDALLGADCVMAVNALHGVRWARLVGNLMWDSPDEVTRTLSTALLRRWV
ncbi:MAG TPA: aminotransferase class IV [Mycobacteriales bacterium]|nr:aminotransferase class IV [Mycobacteriales bacterium]